MARIELPMFIWFPYDRPTKWTIKIDGVDISDDIHSAVFTRGLIGEEMGCEIELENSGEAYTGRFTFRNIIQLLLDFSGGTSVQWEGRLEEIQKKRGTGFILNIKGSHYTGDLLDVTVIEELSSINVSTALTTIIPTYLPGFTSTNVESINIIADLIKWQNKPFYDCVLDLSNLGNADCYVDNNKDFHFFPKNSKENQFEAVTPYEILSLNGLGQDSIDVRNKIVVYGEAGGLPVLHTVNDSSSQGTYGTKEKIITESDVINETQAEEVADAENEALKNPPDKGTAETLMMSQLNPGDSVWISLPEFDITAKFRLARYTFKLPNESMELSFSQDIGIAKMFKDRISKDLSQETIVNPFKMFYSYNFTFDDLTNINQSASNNIEVSNSKLKIVTGTTGTMISLTKTTPVAVNSVHLKVIGTLLSNVVFSVNAEGTDNYQIITPDTETVILNTGNQLKLKAVINSALVEIDSLAILYK